MRGIRMQLELHHSFEFGVCCMAATVNDRFPIASTKMASSDFLMVVLSKSMLNAGPSIVSSLSEKV
jgi:hypothetical protein